MIYGGAQKNIGPAGLGFAIVKKDMLNQAQEITPTMFNYTKMLEGESMYNTPPTFAWYMAGKVFKWLKSKGGLKGIGKVNNIKAKKNDTFISCEPNSKIKDDPCGVCELRIVLSL